MKTVKIGHSGAAVVELQNALKRHGFYVAADGEFGPQTDAAVGQFQLSNDLAADRIVGPKTWTALLTTESRPASIEAENEARLALLYRCKHLKDPQRAALVAAISDLGAQEEPYGSNDGYEIAHLVTNEGQSYRDYWQIEPGDGLPWCAMAVSHWIKLGLGVKSWSQTPQGAWFGGVSQWQKWAKNNGCWSFEASAGSIFVMGRAGSGSDAGQSASAGHCGLVIGHTPISITTIEGNTANKVASRERKSRECVGFIEWWRGLP
tara:strand:+ start:445 stop:1233 length:789 start_codon:yes stop_codon:yes gene_type:complete